MLAHQRQEEIVKEVNAKGSVLVKELSQKYNVTEDSIRKDLSALQKQGLLKKTYGGAVKIKDRMRDIYVSERLGKNIEQKQTLANKAYSTLQEGDMIFLENSTANIELARLIFEAKRNITVVTNMIEILMMATQSSYTKFVMVGGNLNPERDAFIGSVTNEQISKYHFDKSFVSTVAVDLATERVYNNDVEGALTKKTVVENSERCYLLLESKKLEIEGGYEFALMDQFTKVILDEEPTDKEILMYQERGIEWM